jgi:hypothetical protein
VKSLLMMFVAASALCLAADPFVATWKPVDLQKWKISPGGGPGERSKSRVVITALVGKETYRNTYTSLEGKPLDLPPFTFTLDGKGFSNPGSDVIASAERIDRSHIRITASSNKGKVIEDFVVAPDEKTQTITRRGTGTASGRHVDELYIFERQSAAAK